MKILVDVNVIIDAIENREPFAAAAQQILLYVELKYSESYVTADSLTNLYYVIHHLTHSKKRARDVIASTLELFHILDISESDCRLAHLANRPDFEDSILMETAHRHHLDYIVTRNAKNFAHSPVPALTPEALLAKLQKPQKL